MCDDQIRFMVLAFFYPSILTSCHHSFFLHRIKEGGASVRMTIFFHNHYYLWPNSDSSNSVSFKL